MSWLYNLAFNIGLFLTAPYYFFRMWRRGNWSEGFKERFGRYDARIKQAVTNSHVIWLHGVSVGEARMAIPLVEALERRVPNAKLVVSTTTATGMAVLKENLPSHVSKIYFPIDRRKWVFRALATVRPELVVLIESEIWPNFLRRCQRRKTPVVLVNARLSPRSYKRYRRAKPLFGPLFAGLKGVGAQSEADVSRLIDIGCRPEAIEVTGSIKYDTASVPERVVVDTERLYQLCGFPDSSLILIGGSTHAGEEALLAKAFLKLRSQFPHLRLVLAPRHAERGTAVGKELEGLGLSFRFRSQLLASPRAEALDPVDCLLVNSTGELKAFYQSADIVFIGKTLTSKGGQNPIEPASHGKPTLFGPHVDNFHEICAALVAGNAALQVNAEGELESAIESLLKNNRRRQEMGYQAKKVVSEKLGALEKSADLIVESLENPDFYVVRGSGSL